MLCLLTMLMHHTKVSQWNKTSYDASLNEHSTKRTYPCKYQNKMMTYRRMPLTGISFCAAFLAFKFTTAVRNPVIIWPGTYLVPICVVANTTTFELKIYHINFWYCWKPTHILKRNVTEEKMTDKRTFSDFLLKFEPQNLFFLQWQKMICYLRAKTSYNDWGLLPVVHYRSDGFGSAW